MIEKILDVPTISCGHCRIAIEGAVGQLAGVDAVSVDIEGKRVTVRYDGATVQQDAVVAAIEDAGYEVPRGAETASSSGCCG
jgi:copper chaperone